MNHYFYLKGETQKLRTKSPLILVKESGVHGKGIFAVKPIPKGTRIIEYVGEKVTKGEGTRREKLQEKQARKGEGTIYVFELDERWDIDGSVSWNTARYINHSCEPNCEIFFENGGIWIAALRDIDSGEELSYDYGFDLDDFHKYPCKCGKKKCVGYMVAQEHWKELKKLKILHKPDA
ncbi:MAG TPA: SET domain-containing protein-lysine N-methyltransferase [Candidatus Nanoarchaeia archaeon]|nr:SET domain-containing protein-lysine N-methyltransferase [Candidatus Nanoarchaeia archaeon]